MSSCPTCRHQSSSDAIACVRCGSPLEQPDRAAFVLPAGTVLRGGDYLVRDRLGQGGFGITYLGEDTRLQRPVAIKEYFPYGCERQGLLVQPGSLDGARFEEERGRFLDEARTLARFNHPGVPDVYAAFEENDTAYMVIEYLRGGTLGHKLDQVGRLDPAAAVEIGIEVAGALEMIHACSLLHRDIKPDNIILAEDGRVALVDFGASRTFAADRSSRMTSVLTTGYAPLEQYGHEGRFGAPTDLYALGATLYHALTGEPPVEAAARAAGAGLKSPKDLRPEISTTVSEAVIWCLELNARDRPQSAQEFVEALRGQRPIPPAVGEDPRDLPRSLAPAKPSEKPIARHTTPEYPVVARSEVIRWPDRCACCGAGAAAVTGPACVSPKAPRVPEEWTVPYCLACMEHVCADMDERRDRVRRQWFRSGGFFSVLVGLAMLFGGEVLPGPANAAALLPLLGGLVLFVFGLDSTARTQSRLKSLTPRCSAAGAAVVYAGEENGGRRFLFYSAAYAAAFRQENGLDDGS